MTAKNPPKISVHFVDCEQSWPETPHTVGEYPKVCHSFPDPIIKNSLIQVGLYNQPSKHRLKLAVSAPARAVHFFWTINHIPNMAQINKPNDGLSTNNGSNKPPKNHLWFSHRRSIRTKINRKKAPNCPWNHVRITGLNKNIPARTAKRYFLFTCQLQRLSSSTVANKIIHWDRNTHKTNACSKEKKPSGIKNIASGNGYRKVGSEIQSAPYISCAWVHHSAK